MLNSLHSLSVRPIHEEDELSLLEIASEYLMSGSIYPESPSQEQLGRLVQQKPTFIVTGKRVNELPTLEESKG